MKSRMQYVYENFYFILFSALNHINHFNSTKLRIDRKMLPNVDDMEARASARAGEKKQIKIQ